MRKIAVLGASLIAVALVFAAMAADDPIAGVYGNTVVMTTSKGETIKLWVNKDGRFTGESSTGQKFSGKWAVKENKFCTMSDLPPNAPKDAPAPKESCFLFDPGHKVGDKWEQTAADGEKKTIEIVAGM